jgi:hypothetical protein
MLPKPKVLLWAIMQTIKFLVGRGDLKSNTVSEGYVFHKTLLQSLADEGTVIHNSIESYLRDKIDDGSNAVKRFKEFEKSTQLTFEGAEIVVYDSSDDYNSAGTLDLIVRCYDNPLILDIKTSKAIRLSHKIQSTVYRDMYVKMTGKKEFGSGVLLIPREDDKKIQLHINSTEEEIKYRGIYSLLTKLFKALLIENELELK